MRSPHLKQVASTTFLLIGRERFSRFALTASCYLRFHSFLLRSFRKQPHSTMSTPETPQSRLAAMQAGPPPPKSLLGRHRLLSPTASLMVSPLCLGAMNFGDAW